MTLPSSQLTRLYLQQIVSTLVPAESDLALIQGCVSELLLKEPRPTNQKLDKIVQEYKPIFDSYSTNYEWLDFTGAVQLLAEATLKELTASYLIDLVHLIRKSQLQQNTSSHRNRIETNLISSPFAPNKTRISSAPRSSEHHLIHVPLLDAKIMAALLLALVGQETGVFNFLNDLLTIYIPSSIDLGSTTLLTEILEAAILYRGLSRHVSTAKGITQSPIKVAFLRFVESHLLRYANGIDELFREVPESLFIVLNAIESHTKYLKLLSYLTTYSDAATGFNFLSKLYELSQFGDPEICQFATQLFGEIVVPYYQYIEYWIIKGDLVDEYQEFFVQFKKSANHIHDIVQFNTKVLPKFLKLEDSDFEKILQIGKTMIFLEKYCKELAWTNNYSSRYYNFIFKTYSGLQSMDKTVIQDMISNQFTELTNHFTAFIQSKMTLYLHLRNMKRVMFSEAGDFLDTIHTKGKEIFNEPATYLTPSRLSDLLSTSILASSIRNIPQQYVNRIDARILDLSHGTIGWDVFTLEYKIPEVPLEALFNHQNQLTEYLRLFNFLWGLRHFSFFLQQNYLLFQSLQKSELRTIVQSRHLRRPDPRSKWVDRAVKKINLIRHKFLLLVQALLRYVSYDLIEKNFNDKIVKYLFKEKDTVNITKGPLQKLPILNDKFHRMCKSKSTLSKLETIPQTAHNMKNCTLDDIINSHGDYLKSITNSKLLREDMRGRHSGESLVDQVYGFLEISFSFVQGCDQFGSLLTQLATLLKTDLMTIDDDVDAVYMKLEDIWRTITGELYRRRFLPKLETFRRDLRSEADLKDLSKSL